jgi:hypothetical protein
VAGYSGTPLPKKLGIREEHRVYFPGAPKDFAGTLGRLPAGVEMKRRMAASLDVIVFFATRRAELERRFPVLAGSLVADGGLWIAWPKQSSGIATELSDGVVREVGLAAGLVDNKVCAIDATWSALRFVVRLADRP